MNFRHCDTGEVISRPSVPPDLDASTVRDYISKAFWIRPPRVPRFWYDPRATGLWLPGGKKHVVPLGAGAWPLVEALAWRKALAHWASGVHGRHKALVGATLVHLCEHVDECSRGSRRGEVAGDAWREGSPVHNLLHGLMEFAMRPANIPQVVNSDGLSLVVRLLGPPMPPTRTGGSGGGSRGGDDDGGDGDGGDGDGAPLPRSDSAFDTVRRCPLKYCAFRPPASKPFPQQRRPTTTARPASPSAWHLWCLHSSGPTAGSHWQTRSPTLMSVVSEGTFGTFDTKEAAHALTGARALEPEPPWYC